VRDLKSIYTKDKEAAAKLLGTDKSEAAPSSQQANLAAWAIGANLVLNLDEVLTKS